MKVQLRALLIIVMCVTQASCVTLSRELQKLGNASTSNYPAAQATNPLLEKQVNINLAAYKSVHSRKPQHSDITIALAASGGGYRAANLTLGVLLGLEKMNNPKLNGNMLQAVDYFSSVSGGGFGVGYYITQLHNYWSQRGDAENAPAFSLENRVQDMLAHDDVTANPLRNDLTEFLFFGKDRGFEIEQKINSTLLNTPQGGLTLGDVFIPANSNAKVRLPYWVTNSTIFQNATTFPFTPDVIARYRVRGYFHNNQRHDLQGNYSDISYANSIPVSLGLTSSASVPFAVPATTLISDSCDRECYLQLMDGGLTDNLGVYTALSFLLQDQAKTKILVVVDASKSATQPFSKLMSPPQSMALIWRIATASTDANRERVKTNINFVVRDLLCRKGANNVIVIYLDLSRYPQAQQIGTELTISHKNQKMLLKIGQELVANNEMLQKLFKQLSNNQINMGQCTRG